MLKREVEGNKIKSLRVTLPGVAHCSSEAGAGAGVAAAGSEDRGTQGSRGALEPAGTSGHRGRQAGRGRRPPAT